MNLTDSDTFPTALIKRTKLRLNQKNDFPRDTTRLIHTIEMAKGWNIQIVQILSD